MKLQTGAIAICPLWMILNTNIPSGALRFWLYLHAVHNQKRSDLSRADLSDLLDVTVDTIDRWIAVLKNEGCLRVIHNRTKGDGWLPNEYELIMVQGTHQATPEKMPLPSPDSGAKRPSRSRARQAGLLYRDVQLDKNKKDRAIATELHPRFAAWWKRYPRKVRKQATLKIWLRLKVETDDTLWTEIMDGTAKYVEYWKIEATNPRYIPHPTTYLQHARWEDELPTPTPAVSKQSQSLIRASQQFLNRHKGKPLP